MLDESEPREFARATITVETARLQPLVSPLSCSHFPINATSTEAVSNTAPKSRSNMTRAE